MLLFLCLAAGILIAFCALWIFLTRSSKQTQEGWIWSLQRTVVLPVTVLFWDFIFWIWYLRQVLWNKVLTGTLSTFEICEILFILYKMGIYRLSWLFWLKCFSHWVALNVVVSLLNWSLNCDMMLVEQGYKNIISFQRMRRLIRYIEVYEMIYLL